MRPRLGAIGRNSGTWRGIRKPISDRPAAGTALFPPSRAAERAAQRWRRRDSEVRTGAPATVRALSAAPCPRNHPNISRPHDPGLETLEIRHRLDRRGMSARGDAGAAAAVRLPDL